ncbi:hypothetical protein TCSYLVIO_000199 [Trypanosoma cruzi]|nr:hypothetical protein TCSYLVIO_000199 [Trypanosoma cruzi]
MRKFAGGILFRDKFSRPQLVEFVVLGAIAVASFLLMVFLPISRVYCAIALIIVIICGLRLWRLLPSDRRRVLREAHQMADAMLLARRSTNAATMMALSTQLPPSQAALTQAPFMPLAQCAPYMQSGFGQLAALPTQQLLATSMGFPYRQNQVLMMNSMARPLSQQQQAMLSTSMAQPSPQQQQAMLSTSMARPSPQQQQAMLSTSMAQLSPQQQQEMMANTPTQTHPVRFVLQQASRVPEALSPKNQHSTGAGNRLPKQRQDLRSKTQFG